MDFQVRLLKGFTMPYASAYQLTKAEKIQGVWKYSILLIFLSMLITSVGVLFGAGNESLSRFINDVPSNEFEMIKGLFGIGQVLQAMIGTAIILFFPALIFWIFTDIEFKKIVVIQLFVGCISIMEKIILTPFNVIFGLSKASSPFSLGVMAQYITNHEFLIQLFSTISIFSLGALALQFYYLRITTEKSRNLLLLLIISTNLFMWVFTALFSYIKFEVLF
jgi:hypothetical protein